MYGWKNDNWVIPIKRMLYNYKTLKITIFYLIWKLKRTRIFSETVLESMITLALGFLLKRRCGCKNFDSEIRAECGKKVNYPFFQNNIKFKVYCLHDFYNYIAKFRIFSCFPSSHTHLQKTKHRLHGEYTQSFYKS